MQSSEINKKALYILTGKNRSEAGCCYQW